MGWGWRMANGHPGTLAPGTSAFSLLQYRYDCGDHGMQLLAYPTHSHTVRFKVMDEFGTRFDVANCSICLHWLNTGADGAVIFSSGYEGCHVLVKDDHYVLRVQLEEMLLSGVLAASYEVNMTCPQPRNYEILTDGNRATQPQPGLLRPGFVSQNQPGLVSHNAQSGLMHAGAQTQAGFVRPGAQPQNQPGLARPSLQTHSQAGLLRPGLQSTQLTREQCQVAVGRIPCMAPQGQEACLQAGCCYDDMDRVAPCYYGNTATVQCLLDGHFVLVVPRGIVTQPYNLDSVRLASSQAGCEPLRVTETFVMFHFPVTQCGTTVQVIEDRLIYDNQLISTIDVQGSPRGSVTRDSVYILQARCIYNTSDLLPLRMEVAVPPTATPLAMPGPLELQLRIATASHPSCAAGPHLRGGSAPTENGPQFGAGPAPLLGLPQGCHPHHPFCMPRCPFMGDNYRTQLVPVGPASPQLPFPSHYQRFVISTFTFVEPPSMAVLEGEVYISCSASVCHLAQPEPCRPSCPQAAARLSPKALGVCLSPPPLPNLPLQPSSNSLSSSSSSSSCAAPASSQTSPGKLEK
uniref:Zona pellucida glycoprotein 1 n=1 Tax=Strix occidentalis caurina TaxID=311401 RepID=A0A8D0ELW6_STROC